MRPELRDPGVAVGSHRFGGVAQPRTGAETQQYILGAADLVLVAPLLVAVLDDLEPDPGIEELAVLGQRTARIDIREKRKLVSLVAHTGRVAAHPVTGQTPGEAQLQFMVFRAVLELPDLVAQHVARLVEPAIEQGDAGCPPRVQRIERSV